MDMQKALIAEYDRETTNTRKILEAIPEDADFAWKPHDKSMPFGRLAAHVSDTNGDWALHTISHDRLKDGSDYTPYEGRTVQGWPKHCLSRGQLLVESGRYLEPEAGRGRFLAAGKPQYVDL